MKKAILWIGLLLFMNPGFANNPQGTVKNNASPEGTIRIFTTPDLHPLTAQWAGEYSRLNPNVQIRIIEANESTVVKSVKGGRDLGFLSGSTYSTLKAPSMWNIVVGRDVIVPIMNSKNPFVDILDHRGISPEAFARIFEDPKMRTWGILLKDGQNIPVHYYVTGDESVNAKVANFLNVEPRSMIGIPVKNTSELIAAVQKDPYAIGFCRLVNVVDAGSQSLVNNISLMPIDRNGNGRIDYFENIYGDLNSFSRGVWIGKYPRMLSSNIYTVSSEKPVNAAEISFLKWVVTDGQLSLVSNGYSDLALGERQSKLDKLTGDIIATGNPGSVYSTRGIILLTLIGLVILAFIVNAVIWYSRKKKEALPDGIHSSPSAFHADSVKIPNGLYFDKSHTWAFMEKDGIVRVGIDDFLPHVTGPITRIIMKDPGEKIKRGEAVITLIQNGKQLNISAPVSGTIRGVNKGLVKNPYMVNTAPYAEGWIYMIDPTNWFYEVGFMKVAGNYKEWIVNEFSRLKDFLAAMANYKTTGVEVVFQDGGELKDHVLQNMSPELWEDFQQNFINTSALR